MNNTRHPGLVWNVGQIEYKAEILTARPRRSTHFANRSSQLDPYLWICYMPYVFFVVRLIHNTMINVR